MAEKTEVITYQWVVEYSDGSTTYFRSNLTMLQDLVETARRCHGGDEIKIRRLKE